MNLYCLPFLESLPDKVMGIIASLIKGIADALYSPLAGAGLSIDSLMNGVTNGHSTAFFSMDTGNIYGILGAQLFVGTRNIFLILIGVTFMFSLLRAAASPNASNKGEAKTALGNVALAMLIVAWTPALLSFFVWLRRFFLEVVRNAVTIGGSGDLHGIYANNAGGKNVTGAILYLAFVGVGIYFAFYYICMAIMQSIMLGILPLTALQSVQDSSRLRSWYQTFLGWMLIPMVDYVLFMVPIGLYMLNASSLVILVSMFALLPVCFRQARNRGCRCCRNGCCRCYLCNGRCRQGSS